MRWLIFFIIISFLLSCHAKKEPAQQAVTISKDSLNRVRQQMIFVGRDDTGYFRNLSSEPVTEFGGDKDSPFYYFLERNLDRKNTIIHNINGLLHSCYIFPDTTIRIDTLKDANTVIIQKTNLKQEKILSLSIDGYELKSDEFFDFIPESFRHFTFKGKEFYYLKADILNCGGSICPLTHYLIYEKEQHKLNVFSSYRTADYLYFGDINGDDQLDFLHIENDGMWRADQGPNEFIIKLYSCNNKGKFELLKDKKGKTYYISGNTGHDLYVADSINITKYYWPVVLK